MSTFNFAEVYNMIAFLSKPTKSAGFEQIIDFLNAHPIKYALTINPTIYTSCIEQFWTTAKAKNINGEAQIHAKKRVNKMERERKSRTPGLKRLYKIGLTARVKSSANEESLSEDVVVEDVNAATFVTVAATTTVSFDELTLAQALMKIKTSKPKEKGIVMQEPSEATTTTTTTMIPSIKPQDKGKGIMLEHEMPLKKIAQISLDEEFAFKLQAEEDKQERIIKEKAQQIAEVNLTWDDVQAKINADYEMA
nr:hypothetical protein [Tanacetum cinerariifolium]